jgi:hypothetical protein
MTCWNTYKVGENCGVCGRCVMPYVIVGDTLIYLGMDSSKYVPCVIVRRAREKVVVEATDSHGVFEDKWFRFKKTPETSIKCAMRARSEASGR